MIIQKIYSEVEQGEEKIYSVLMTEDEMKLYSKKAMTKEEYDKTVKENRKDALKVAGHGVAGAVDSGIAYVLGKSALKKKSKLAALGSAAGATGAILHGVEAVKKSKEISKRADDPRYIRRFKKEAIKDEKEALDKLYPTD